MSKELDAFNRIMETYGKTNSLEGTYDDFLPIKQALQRLEAIDNSNHSEALECLENIYTFSDDYNDGIYRFEKEYNTIKKYILKAQEYKEFVDVILKHMTNNGWSNDFTIDFWNMNEKELKVVNKMFEKRGK